MNVLSLLLYLTALPTAAYLLSREKDNRGLSKLNILGVLLLTALGGLRVDTGTDFKNYQLGLDTLSAISLTEYINNHSDTYEIGTFLIAQLSGLTSLSSITFFSIFSLITSLSLAIALKRLALPSLWLATLLCLLIVFPASFNAVRQLAAVSIFILASTYLLDRKAIKYMLAILFASVFHKSAILLLLIYPLGTLFNKHREITMRLAIISLLLITAISLLAIPIVPILLGTDLFSKYSKYTTASESSSGLQLLLKIAILGFIAIIYKRFRKHPNVAFFIAASSIEVAILTLALQSVDIARFSIYFSIFPLLLMSYIPNTLSKGSRSVAFVAVAAYGVFIFITNFYILGGSEIFPYKSILSSGGLNP